MATQAAQVPQKESLGDLDDIKMSPSTFKISDQESMSGTICEVSPEVSKNIEQESEDSQDSSE